MCQECNYLKFEVDGQKKGKFKLILNKKYLIQNLGYFNVRLAFVE